MKNTNITRNKELSQQDITRIHYLQKELQEKSKDEYEKYNVLFNNVKQEITRQSHTTMRIRRSLLGLYTCEVVIDHVPLTFLIDTGAQISGILASVAKRLSLSALDVDMSIGSVGGGAKKAKMFLAKSLNTKLFEVVNEPLIELEDAHFQIPKTSINIMKFDGILGWDILRHLDFELDDKERCMRLLNDDIDFPYKNFLSISFPTLIVLDKHKHLQALGFDSGAKDAWVSAQYIEKANLHVHKEKIGYGMGVLGVEQLHLQQVKEVIFYLHYAKISLSEVISGRVDMINSIAVQGVLGNRIFRNRKLQIYNSKSFFRIL